MTMPEAVEQLRKMGTDAQIMKALDDMKRTVALTTAQRKTHACIIHHPQGVENGGV